MKEAYGCNGGQRCICAEAASPVLGIQSRKALATLKGGEHGPTSNKNGKKKLVFRGLMATPGGPDPIHHPAKSPWLSLDKPTS